MSRTFFICALADDISGTVLDLHIYLAHILADNSKADKLYSADKADDTGHTCPARNGMTYRDITTDQITPIKLMIATITPIEAISLSGFTLRLVMPSMARFSIFFRG